MEGTPDPRTRPETGEKDTKKLDKKIKKALKAPFDEDKFGKIFEISFPLTEEQLPKIIKSLRNQMKLEKTCHKELLRQSLLHFLRINNIQKICLKKHEKIYIVGDLHGQFYDMLEIFVQSGFPAPSNKYVFNGDLVDRGCWSCEIFILLMCTMLTRPWSVYINRGNHECSMMSAMYGFQKELEHKYSLSFINEYIKMFYSLPLGTLLSLPRHQIKVENIIDYLGDKRMSFVYDKDNNPIKAKKIHKHISKSCMISKKKDRDEFLGLKKDIKKLAQDDSKINQQNNNNNNNKDNDDDDDDDELAQQIIDINTRDELKSKSVGKFERRLTSESSIKVGPRIIIFHGGLPLPIPVEQESNDKNKNHKTIYKPVTLKNINDLKRYVEPDENTNQIITQILWSDPMDEKGSSPSYRSFSENFGPDITKQFMEANRLSYLIRSHEVVDGHIVHNSHQGQVITLFSAPNVVEEGNAGEYVQFDGDKIILFPDKWVYHKIHRSEKPKPVWTGRSKSCTIM